MKRASGYRKHITKRGRELLARKDMQPAIKLFEKATRASRAHSRLVSESMDKYGDQGPQISGIIREHFPTDVKNRLRKLARDINKYADAAYYARPKGVRNTTMQALAGAVATKTGTGFYGPAAENPKRKGTKTMARKKPRTAKQRAATKKMLAANRARLRKKTKTARRKTRGRKVRRKVRRNPQKARPGLKARKKLYVAFVCWPKGKVNYAYIADTRAARVGISSNKGQSVLFQTKTRAHNVAKLLAKIWPGARAGVANADATAAEIRAACLGKS